MKKVLLDAFLLAIAGGFVSCEQNVPQEQVKQPSPEKAAPEATVSNKQVKPIAFPVPQVFRDESVVVPSVEDSSAMSSDSAPEPESSESAESSSSPAKRTADKVSSAEESSSSEPPAPVFCESVPAGMLCDKRDGQLYRLTTIGKQVWMAQNLNYRAEGSSCYENKMENCKIYGRLYPWTAAMDLPASYASASAEALLSQKHKGVCPEGFHMPRSADMKTLVSYIMKHNKYEREKSGTLLKMAFSWKHSEELPDGTDRFGFSAMASGFKNASGEFREMGRDADFWVAEESNNPSHAPYWNLYYDNDEFLGDYSKKKTYAYSVRCLRDRGSTSSETKAAEKALEEAAKADSSARDVQTLAVPHAEESQADTTAK